VDIDMTKEEREQQIEIMVARRGWSRLVFENKSDEEVEREYMKVLSEQDD
jgi:hypothetical protein